LKGKHYVGGTDEGFEDGHWKKGKSPGRDAALAGKFAFIFSRLFEAKERKGKENACNSHEGKARTVN